MYIKNINLIIYKYKTILNGLSIYGYLWNSINSMLFQPFSLFFSIQESILGNIYVWKISI